MLVFLLACLGSKNIDAYYQVANPSRLWIEVSQTPADRAWRNAKLNSLIYVKANCGNYFEDRNLEDSLLSLTRGLNVNNPINTESIIISGRKGLFQVQDSEVDGVPLRLGILVVSKNNCLYDFLFISPRKHFAEGIGDFMNTAQSLKTNTNLNRTENK